MQYMIMLKTAYQLLKTDIFKFFRYTFVDAVVNMLIFIACTVVIANYVWPSVGMSQSFGVFMGIGSIVSCMFWDCWGISVQFIADLEGNNTTQYYISLPIPAPLFFFKQIIFYALRALVQALCVLPLLKIILWNQLDLSGVQIIPLAIVLLTASFFCASLSLFVTGRVRDMHSIDNISMRFLFPIWFFGGSQFSWYTLSGISPVIGYISLLNPLLYAMEAMHVVFLGASGYLPFWTSIGVLWLFNIVLSIYGARKLMVRLDCI